MVSIWMPFCLSWARISGVKCRPAVGAAALPGSWRVDGLVAVAVFRFVVAVDVGRERHVADLFEDGLEVGHGGEAEGAFAELSGGEDFGFEERLGFVGGVEEEALAGLDFAAGADEGGPVVSRRGAG